MASLKVVLDTHVILSGIAYPASIPGKIVRAWWAGSIEVFLSRYILDELQHVMPKLHDRHGFNDQETEDFIEILSFHAEILEPTTAHDTELRDPADEKILGTFIRAKELFDADYLISGDKDLLALDSSYPIMTPADFWRRHGAPILTS